MPVVKSGSLWTGEVTAVDRSGNLITNFKTCEVAPLAKISKLWVEFGKNKTTVRGLSDAFSAVEPGKLLVIGGGDGYMKIAIHEGNAAVETKLMIGDPVLLHFRA